MLAWAPLEQSVHRHAFVMKGRAAWSLLKETSHEWKRDNASRLSAALAYYTVLSLAPLIVITLSIAGLAFGNEAARGQLASELGAIVGGQAAQGVQTIVSSAQQPKTGAVSAAIGALALLFGASGVFTELQSSLDTIWDVAPRPDRGFWATVKERLFSFTLVLGVAFLLLVSLVLSAALSALGTLLARSLPGGEALWHVVNAVVSFAVITVLFALIFRYVPHANVGWRDVWAGAAATAVLFTIGKFVLGLYLGKSTVGSAYGAAGSVVVLVVWVYYAAQILFFGAEFTQVKARRRGSGVPPSQGAVRLERPEPHPAE